MKTFKEFLGESFRKAWKIHWKNEKRRGNPELHPKTLKSNILAAGTFIGGSTAASVAGAALTANSLVNKNYGDAAMFGAYSLGAAGLLGHNIRQEYRRMKGHFENIGEIHKKLKEMKKRNASKS